MTVHTENYAQTKDETIAELRAHLAEARRERDALVSALESAAACVERRSLSFNGERRAFIAAIRAALAKVRS